MEHTAEDGKTNKTNYYRLLQTGDNLASVKRFNHLEVPIWNLKQEFNSIEFDKAARISVEIVRDVVKTMKSLGLSAWDLVR